MILTFELPKSAPAPSCAACHGPMRLFGIEWETERVDLCTYHCPACGAVETRPVIRP